MINLSLHLDTFFSQTFKVQYDSTEKVRFTKSVVYK